LSEGSFNESGDSPLWCFSEQFAEIIVKARNANQNNLILAHFGAFWQEIIEVLEL
jgi:hypothetical protein